MPTPPVATPNLRRLESAAATPGVDVVWLTERTAIAQLRDKVVAGNTAQMTDPDFMGKLRRWLRFSHEQALANGDGLFTAVSGIEVLLTWLGSALFDWFVSTVSEDDRLARHMRATARVAVFVD